MSRFQYKFQAIEDIKEKIKKNSEKEYALSRKVVDAKKDEINEIKNNLEETFTEQAKMTPQEMIFRASYREALIRKMELKEKELAILEDESKHKLAQLVEHHKDHKVFERLKEKHLDEFTKEQTKLEMKFIDEIANQKFNRKEK
ncbi:MAG: flagellar export protein FliJ [Melioribacteraceae bacterium]|jgi:flagellar FliJ protein|nr:flagellar export protein FliJ [Melioribacteraceae bacterium]